MARNIALKPEERSMSINELVLAKLAEWRPDTGRQTLVVSAPPNNIVSVTADRSDVVGAQLWEVTFRRPLTLDAAGLKTWGENLAGRATGLLEPLRLLEVDAERKTALLRSQTPTQRGEDLLYYEVLLQGEGRADVRRYQASQKPEVRRQQIAYTLTHETLAKLISDIEAAI
jgi:hypothetical protein